MQVGKCIATAEKYKEINPELILCRIGDASSRHNRNENLSNEDKFFLGLRYSEFFAEDTTDESYYQASIKRDACLKILNIDFNWLMNECIRVCGLH